ncbi:MAG: hypothetical protein H5T86_10820 [Armatimonadetes bacterium]|nr:hypothetical protein [Armatimonadota bacterium]
MPAETPLYLDAVRWYEPTSAANMLRGSLLVEQFRSPHGDTGSGPMNVGYADGHVKSLPVMTAIRQLRNMMPLN